MILDSLEMEMFKSKKKCLTLLSVSHFWIVKKFNFVPLCSVSLRRV